MIRFLTSGESHGRGLTAIIEGFPSNIGIQKEFIDLELKRRQHGYGRGGRMKIESDSVEILAGVRGGKTLGSPIALFIENKDWVNWKEEMGPEKIVGSDKITIPRPGHADLVGFLKYNFNDIRNSIERSSARETAARVAAGAVAKLFLNVFNIQIGSFVESIGGVYPNNNRVLKQLFASNARKLSPLEISLKADKSPVRVLSREQEKKIIEKIKEAKVKGDTLGGTFYVIATGVPVGLGSFVHYDVKLNADIAQAIMSINAVKGVEIGKGFKLADMFGSEAHDYIVWSDKTISRRTNRAGGIEGGISNGMPIVVRAAMKPIATLMSPVTTIDLKTGKQVKARRERSDFVAVPACAVVAESMLAWSIAKFFLLKFGGDSIEEIKRNYAGYQKQILKRISK